MAGPEFFQTGIGRKFYEGDVPKIAAEIGRVAVELHRIANSLEGGQKVADNDSEMSKVSERRQQESLEKINWRMEHIAGKQSAGILWAGHRIRSFSKEALLGIVVKLTKDMRKQHEG